ncbi:NAC domain containing protein 50 [Prunus dulcis]|uniref:NAC domain containing protein 50 n=1 Tax=Prunus dulcis TaxID=3755 RepID=A0A4Y1QXR9_PRUDU|nr:NAC domain containing protein 50 [Prunus dulcis]
MPGIAPEVISHKLSISPAYKPVGRSADHTMPNGTRQCARKVDKLQTIGFIREATYPVWLANSVMVRKPRRVANVPRLYRSQQGLPEGQLSVTTDRPAVDATAGHELLSFMDAYSGYNQIFMHPPDSEHTAFITDKGLYCYNVMPFGLKNAGATYQRLSTKSSPDTSATSWRFTLTTCW